jgi:primosomal protein N' (replication factor Y) (superfamily II helicase)
MVQAAAESSRHYVEVAVATVPGLPRRAGAGLPGAYTYHLTDEQGAIPGVLVEVPFGSRLLPGIVVGRIEQPEFPTRPVVRQLGESTIVGTCGIALARFVAQTYRAPLFDCLALTLPPGFIARLSQAQRDGAWSPPRFRTPAPTFGTGPAVDQPARLTHDQAAARTAIVERVRSRCGGGMLLYGVTGSGKTLVYLEAADVVVAAGRQVIVLVSEIGLTSELADRFMRRFPGRTVLLHSELSAAQRYYNWAAVRSGQAQVVIGPRSALFAPAERLGLVVLDEEHEAAYKQEESPRYHARDVALELGRLARVPVLLSSATPDVSTAWRAKKGELSVLALSGRYQGSAGSALPDVEVVDLREELRAGNMGIFSRALQRELTATIERSEQAIFYINRRGAATSVNCRHCGYVVSCRRCDVPLVYHRDEERLVCHRCGRRRATVTRCPGCGSGAIRHFGVGTQRVEQELRTILPEVRLLRWDRDMSRRRGGHADVWTAFRDHQADVLIGTQLVAKALDFPRVTLVGVILADVGLYLPDFRAGERTFQLLTQVAGRAGRGARRGRAIVQTYSPDHYAVRLAAHHDYAGFLRRELAFRQQLGYPPFGRLVRFVFSGSDDAACSREAIRLGRELQARLDALADPELRLIGPAPCYARRIRGRYRWQLVVRGVRLQELLEGVVLRPGWILDVDPVNLL